MPVETLPTDSNPPGFWRAFFAALTGRSVGWAVGLAILVALMIAPIFRPPLPVLFGRTLFIAIVVLLAFTAAGQWRRAPLPRWVLRLSAVVLTAPIATLAVYLMSTGGDWQALFGNEARVTGFILIGGSALALGLVLALGAMYRERDAQANAQALQFALERETLQRQATDAQLKVLQSQVEPHFLFNTLANVQALVESGSSRAAPVLGSLIAYLRAAMPQLHQAAPTLGQEETLVRSYLELMQMRMPDRLVFAIDVDPALRGMHLPAMTLLTLVENAVRHGIDPSEAGGRIEVGARRDADDAVTLWVQDSGRGIDESQTPGTGLTNLRERLLATYGERACLALHAVEPHGLRAEISLPGEAVVNAPTALIADDEPLLRERLAAHLARLWPELQVVAQARNGREAVELFEDHAPAVVFLDVHMPGLSGIDAARCMVQRTQIVFVTAYEQYAVKAFEQGAIDYLVKPFDEARLAETVQRLKQRLQPNPAAGEPTGSMQAVLDRLAGELRSRGGPGPEGHRWLQWIKASVGTSLRLIPVEQVVFLRSDEKYTLVVWDGGEALIRRTIRELADELDPERFAQIHRSVIVNLARIAQVSRGVNETADVHLSGRSEVLPVSRSYLHLFRQM